MLKFKTPLLDKKLLILMAGVLVVAAMVRFPGLRTSPPWYTDEGFYLNGSWNIIHGQVEVSGISRGTFLPPIFPILPLYHFVVGTLLVIFGKSLLVARILTASAGVITAVSLTYIGQALFRSKLAGAVIGFAYATIPVIVINNRWAFPQNLTGIFLLWSAFFLWQYRSTRRPAYDLAGCLLAGAAFMTSYWCWLFLGAVFFIYRGLERRRSWFAIGQILLLPIGVLVIRACLVPTAFWTDINLLGLTSYAVGGNAPVWLEFLSGCGQYFSRDPLFFVAIIGMLIVKPQRLRTFLLSVFFFSAIALLVKRTSYAAWFYSGLTFTPLLLLGLGAGITTMQQKVGKNWRRTTLICAIIVFLYCTVQVGRIFYNLNNKSLATLATQRIAFITHEDDIDTEKVTAYINSNTNAEDFVIAPNALNWQIKARTVDALWSACYQHQQDFGRLFQDRFPRPLGVHYAKYIVEDRIFVGDVGICDYGTHEILDTALAEHWPIVLSVGRFRVYQNPSPITERQ